MAGLYLLKAHKLQSSINSTTSTIVMRTTWIILLLMLLAGGIMYYFAKRPHPPVAYDTIRVVDSTDTIYKKIKVFIANNPVEIHYVDTLGWQQDSVQLKKILDSAKSNTFDKKYRSSTLFITYNNEYFFDLEINKPDSNVAYDISFTIKPSGNAYSITGAVDNKKDYVINFKGPMLKLYKEFLVTYNNKLPPPPKDSTVLAEPKPDTNSKLPGDTGTAPEPPKPNKTVIILRK